MADMIKVRLQRAYLWINEGGGEESYGPGEVEIPRAMAEGLQREKVDIGLPATTQTQEGDVHPKIFAQRESDASVRAVKAATTLAKRFSLTDNEVALKVEEQQPDLQQVLRDEAVADTLEALVKTTPANVDTLVGDAARQAEEAVGQRLKEAAKQGREALLAVIEELPGIGPKSLEAISTALDESESLSTATTPSGENADTTSAPTDATETGGESPDATG